MTERIIRSLVGPDNEGTTLIEYLSKRFTYCDMEQWRSFIEAGRLLVDEKQGYSDQRLASGQFLDFIPPADLEPAADSAYRVIYQSSRLLVVFKPPLLPIHPGGRFFAHTLWYLLTRDYGKAHIITRLDRETSGLVLVARDAETARKLQQQQSQGAIKKTYLALVHGKFPRGIVQAKGWLVQDDKSLIRKKRKFLRYGVDLPLAGEYVKPAAESSAIIDQVPDFLTPAVPRQNEIFEIKAESCETIFLSLGSWLTEDGQRSLIQARLITGRTHQIRASLFSMGYPILGDKLYGLDENFFLRFIDNSLTTKDLNILVLPYQALHCSSIVIRNLEAEQLEFSSPAPWVDLVKTL